MGGINRTVLSTWVSGVQSVNTDDLMVESWAKDEELREDKYAFKSDAEIRQAIDDAFLYDPRILSYEPDIEVENGNVTLRGTVTSLAAKRAAEEDAKNIVGVVRVKNKLNVRPAPVILDQQIAQNVEDALLMASGVDRFDINVNVINGKVYLSGEVDNYFQKYQATDVVSSVVGVIDVENNISVNDAFVRDYYRDWATGEPLDIHPEMKLDWEIEEDIEEQFQWSAFVDADEINVEVEDGVATLNGTVDTWTEYRYAEKNAFEGGAESVDNNLTVRYGSIVQ